MSEQELRLEILKCANAWSIGGMQSYSHPLNGATIHINPFNLKKVFDIMHEMVIEGDTTYEKDNPIP